MSIKKFIFSSLVFLSFDCFSATTSVQINNQTYTQITSGQAWVSVPKASTYCFSSSQPSSSAFCHHTDININIPINSTESGVYLWMKSDSSVPLANVSITSSSDASLGGGSGSVSGGATAANQTSVQANAGSDASKAVSVQGITGGKPLGINISQLNGSTTPTGTGTATGALRVAFSDSSAVSVTGVSTLTEQQTQTTELIGVRADTSSLVTHLASIDTKTPSLGQSNSAGSVPVVIANDQSPINVSGSSVVITDGSATAFQGVSDPFGNNNLGVATYARVNASAPSYTDNTLRYLSQDTLGNLRTAASQSGSWGVTANAGTNLNTSALALESGGNLASIKTNTDKIPAQGLAATSASVPVTQSIDVISDCTGSANPTITTGGTSQTARTANASDKSIEIYNNDSTESLCFKYGTTATLNDYCIQPLGYYSNTLNNQRVDIIATTTGHKFKCSIRQ